MPGRSRDRHILVLRPASSSSPAFLEVLRDARFPALASRRSGAFRCFEGKAAAVVAVRVIGQHITIRKDLFGETWRLNEEAAETGGSRGQTQKRTQPFPAHNDDGDE